MPTNTQGFTAALASIEPSTGKVRAIVGGPGFDTYKFDLATQAFRQPGSGFKLFTLLAAYEAGYGPNDTVDGSSPCAINFPGDPDLLKNPAHNSRGQRGRLTSASPRRRPARSTARSSAWPTRWACPRSSRWPTASG